MAPGFPPATGLQDNLSAHTATDNEHKARSGPHIVAATAFTRTFSTLLRLRVLFHEMGIAQARQGGTRHSHVNTFAQHKHMEPAQTFH